MKAGMKYSFSDERLNELIIKYENAGGEVIMFDDGSLRTGTVLFRNNGAKLWEFVAYEQYLNAWSSDEIVIKYKSLPKKWLKRLEEYYNEVA